MNNIVTGIKVDLHVHTPASDDYKGEKSEAEYRRIVMDAIEAKEATPPDGIEGRFTSRELSQSGEENIQMIAITDHNTVDGFKYIMKAKSEAAKLYKTLRSRSVNSESFDAAVTTLQEEIEAFNKLHILMGVEVKADPGVHLLTIFKEDIAPADVDEFLKNCFEEEFVHVKGDPEPMMHFSIKQYLDELQRVFTDDAFVILPHADSSSGLFVVCKEAAGSRKNALTHNIVKAISLTNYDNKEKYLKYFDQPDYKRSSDICFIQSSDYHGQKDNKIGMLHAEIAMERDSVNYTSLHNALASSKNIKCSSEYIEDTYRNLTMYLPLSRFESASNEHIIFNVNDVDRLCKDISAYLNSGPGIFEIRGTLFDLNDKPDIIKRFHEELVGTIGDNIQPKLGKNIDIRILPWSSNKYRLLCRIKKSSHLHMSNNSIYVIKDKAACLATPRDVEFIVADKMTKRWGLKNQAKLDELSTQTRRLAKAQAAAPLIIKSEESFLFPLESEIEVKHIETSQDCSELNLQINEVRNGYSEGNVQSVMRNSLPRQKKAYVRFTTPKYKLTQEVPEELICASTNELLVHEGGAVTLLEPGLAIYNNKNAVKLRLAEKYDSEVVLGWFKSSYFLYYCSTILGTEDLYGAILKNPKIIPVLKYRIKDQQKEQIKTLVKRLAELELEFLDLCTQSETSSREDSTCIKDQVDKHNNAMTETLISLDQEIFKTLNLTVYDAFRVYKSLDDIGIFVFGVEISLKFFEVFSVLEVEN